MSTGARTGASELLRSLGLMVDGPVRWTDPVSSRKPGVFVVELPGAGADAPIDVVTLRRWIDRVAAFTLGGERPTPQVLARRLAEFWLPDEPVLYVGRSARAVGARVAAMYATTLGDAKPFAGGHWLKTLGAARDLRIWWSDTDAHEEYEDALLELIANRNDGRPPFAHHTLENSLLAETDAGASASSRAATVAGTAKAPRRAAATSRRPAARRSSSASSKPQLDPTYLSAEGHERLTSELEHLRTSVRPEVIARVKAARELGDLRENADYEYARKEQSFVEGRIQALEALLRTGVVMDEPTVVNDAARLASTVVVESEGERLTFVLVSSAEANASAGRISTVSPVGRALLGARAGDEVIVQLPSGSVGYRVIEVR